MLATLQDYGIVILASAAVLIIWALHNQLRFRGQHRRRAGKTVDVADLGELYGRPAADVAHWQQSRILILQHAPDGTLISALAKIPVKQGDAA